MVFDNEEHKEKHDKVDVMSDRFQIEPDFKSNVIVLEEEEKVDYVIDHKMLEDYDVVFIIFKNMGKIEVPKVTIQEIKEKDVSCNFKENQEKEIDNIVIMLSFYGDEVIIIL